jgi:hypothetical protein
LRPICRITPPSTAIGERVFFEEGDYVFYRNLMATACRKSGVVVPPDFLSRIARELGRSVKPAKRGRKPKAEMRNG